MKRLAGLLVFVVAACGPAASAVPSTTTAPSSSANSSPSHPPSPAMTVSASPAAVAGEIREVRFAGDRLAPADIAGPTAQRVVAGDAAFAFQLYARLARTGTNLIYSPYSISTALSMTLGGARGATATQLASALGASADPAIWQQGRNDLDQWLNRPPPNSDEPGYVPLQIQPTNALFGQDGFTFAQPYLELLSRDYDAGLRVCDFADAFEACRAAINAWVAGQTADKIKELLARGSIDEMTRFVLVNAILFRAGWSQLFEASQTAPASFHLLDGHSVDVQTMHTTAEGMVTRGDGWRAVELSYSGASMAIILPDSGRFAAVERGLDAAFLASIDAHQTFDLVHLSLPRWSSTMAVDLIPHLKALGIRDLFDRDAADLRGIADVPLSVSLVVHQATISVDEHGTEAAAATAVGGGTTGGGPDRETTIRVDHPFIYLIRDDASGEILFMGRVLDPGKG